MAQSATAESASRASGASAIQVSRIGRLLAWYRAHARVLPWRAGPGEAADPYPVWLSEIMLQQTTVATVVCCSMISESQTG